MEQQKQSVISADLPSNLLLIKFLPDAECEEIPEGKVHYLGVKDWMIGKHELAEMFIRKSRWAMKPERIYFLEDSTGIPFENGTVESLRRKCLIQNTRQITFYFTINNQNQTYEEDIQYIPHPSQSHLNPTKLSIFCCDRNQSFTLTITSLKLKERYEELVKKLKQKVGLQKQLSKKLSLQADLKFTKININEDNLELIQEGDSLNLLTTSSSPPQQNTYILITNTFTSITQRKIPFSNIKGRFVRNILQKQFLFTDSALDSNNYFILLGEIPVLANETIDDFQQIKKLLNIDKNQVTIICGNINEYCCYFKFTNDFMKKRSALIWDYHKRQQYNQFYGQVINGLPEQLRKANIMDLKTIVSFANNFQISVNGTSNKIYDIFTKQFYQKKINFKSNNFNYFAEIVSSLSQMPKKNIKLYYSSQIVFDLQKQDCVRFDFPTFWFKSREKAIKKQTKTLFEIVESQISVDLTHYLRQTSDLSVVILPFTSFQVIGINFDSIFGNELTIYTIKAKNSSIAKSFGRKKMYILWVKRGFQQGLKQSRQHLIPNRTTTIILMDSTKQLQDWLLGHSASIKLGQLELVLITNMNRMENNELNKEAGCDSIDLFRKYCPSSHILVYVGNVINSTEVLKSRGILINQRLACKSLQADLHEFFKKIYDQ